MEQISFNLAKYKEKKKACHYEWQNRALEIFEFLGSPENKKSQILKLVRDKRDKVEAVIAYMQSRGIENIFYFFKCINSK